MKPLTKKRHHAQNNIQNNTQNNTQNKKKRKTAKKRITFHHNVKKYNGKNIIPREKTVYQQSHIFPYITSNNLVKGNLWSTSKNMKNAINDATQSLSDVKRINEKVYLLKHKRLLQEPAKIFKNLATTLSPAEFAHVKAKWIASNVLQK